MIQRLGIGAAPGVAIGPALVLDTEEYRVPRRAVSAEAIGQQREILDAALEASRHEVRDLRIGAARKLGEQTSAIFAFHEEFIADPKLRQAVIDFIENRHCTAAFAFEQVIRQKQQLFRQVADPYLKERARDLYDIQKRVLRHILGRVREDIGKLSEPVIIVAHDISPSDAVTLDRRHILGLAVDVGGQTSHTAIITRMLGIPAVVALESFTSDVSGGDTVIVDGAHGIVFADPDPETVVQYRSQQREYRRLVDELKELRDLPAETEDGERLTVRANIELSEEAGPAIETGAEGVGLYRTEFLFLSRTQLPTEQEQYEAFRAAAQAMRGLPITFRTMDLGADKLPGALQRDHDQNPVLGLRSLRFCMRELGMFRTHLRALLRASVEGDVRIMFPMITQLMELRQAKHVLGDVMEDLDEAGIPYREDIPLGIMIETPAAAILADAFMREVNFVSIGTNDLTQYTLAVDRANERVAQLYAPHNPAVLRLMRMVVRAAQAREVELSLCGEMAGQTIYTQLLIGLGVRNLSMAPKDIPEVKRLIRNTTLTRCRAVARRVMRFDADREVLNYLRGEMNKLFPEAP